VPHDSCPETCSASATSIRNASGADQLCAACEADEALEPRAALPWPSRAPAPRERSEGSALSPAQTGARPGRCQELRGASNAGQARPHLAATLPHRRGGASVVIADGGADGPRPGRQPASTSPAVLLTVRLRKRRRPRRWDRRLAAASTDARAIPVRPLDNAVAGESDFCSDEPALSQRSRSLAPVPRRHAAPAWKRSSRARAGRHSRLVKGSNLLGLSSGY